MYEELVSNLRLVAGNACRDAWSARPARNDAEMSFASSVIDLSLLKTCEDAFSAASQRHLKDKLSLKRLWAQDVTSVAARAVAVESTDVVYGVADRPRW